VVIQNNNENVPDSFLATEASGETAKSRTQAIAQYLRGLNQQFNTDSIADSMVYINNLKQP